MTATRDTNWKLHLATAATLVILAAVLYAPTLHDPIFLWDDIYLIEQNEFLRNPGAAGRVFTKDYFLQKYELSYRPVGTLSLIANYALGGIDPFGYRLVNVALHAACGILLYLLMIAILGDRARSRFAAVLAAALFVAHPANTEAVNGITFREDLLCLAFCLLSVLTYIFHRRTGRVAPLMYSLLFFALALFSKEPAVVLPAVIFAWDMLLRDPGSRPAVRLKSAVRSLLPFAACTGIYLYIRFFVMAGPEEQIVYHGHSAATTLLFTADAWIRYLRLVFYPITLCFEYPYTGTPAFSSGVPALAALAGLLLLPWLVAVRRPSVSLGLFWYILFLLPASNIIPIGVVMADRYLYISLAGAALAGAALIAAPEDGSPAKSSRITIPMVLAGIGVAGLVFFSFLTVRRNHVWSHEIAFQEQTVSCAPDSAKAWINLGLSYDRAKTTTKALAALETAVSVAERQDPQNDRYGALHRAHGNLGMVFMKQDRPAQAAYHLRQALDLHPGYAPARRNLNALILRCRALAERREAAGDIQGAAEMYRLLVTIDPRSKQVYRDILRDLEPGISVPDSSH